MRLSNLTCPSYFNYGKGKDLQQATYICWPMKFSSRKTLQENSRILCLIPYFTRWIFFVKNIIGAISVFSSGWHSLTTGEVKSAQSKLKNQFWKFFQHSKWAPHHCWALDHTSYLSILVHRRIIEVYKKYTKFGQHFAFAMLKSTPARKKYTTAGCGSCDKYELCSRLIYEAVSDQGPVWVQSEDKIPRASK